MDDTQKITKAAEIATSQGVTRNSVLTEKVTVFDRKLNSTAREHLQAMESDTSVA